MTPRTPGTAPAPDRRLIAAGITRRHDGRTVRITITSAGVTGTITHRPVVTR